MNHQGFTIRPGLAADHIDQACDLFWEAFRQKLTILLKPEDKALAFVKSAIGPDHAISAIADDGSLLGVAGFKTKQGAFVGGDLEDLRAIFGSWGGLWRGLLLGMLDRELTDDILLMDGIFVDPKARGQGVGTALLEAVAQTAHQRGLSKVRLDVIDINPRARALYERCGFRAIETNDIGPFKHLFGFQSSTTMHLNVTDPSLHGVPS